MAEGTFANKIGSYLTVRTGVLILAIAAGFAVYIIGIGSNPPGFYLDESVLSYNGYLVATTGAGESGDKYPLYFPVYEGGFTQYSNPTHIYLLAGLFTFFDPSIITARIFAAVFLYAACIMLGFLAYRLSGRELVGIAVGIIALLTPWLFELSRLVLETFFYPLAIVLFLTAVARVRDKETWTITDIAAITAGLVLITYSYTIGRMLGPGLAAGLIIFATGRQRLFSVIKTWAAFAVTLIPLGVYIYRNPEITQRFSLLSYIKPETPVTEIITTFIRRFIEDINPLTMLFAGDVNQRHHIPDAYGSFFIAVFVLALIGLATVIIRHRNEAWWRYIVYGTLVSIVPGALTIDKFHTLRLLAYPIFLIVLTIPAISWFLSRNSNEEGESADEVRFGAGTVDLRMLKRVLIAGILVFGAVEVTYFHYTFYTKGGERGYVFDTAYKPLYDAALLRPERPIFLVDGYWGPAYIHSFWYATVEGQNRSMFFHMPYGRRPPPGSLVLSSEKECTNCEMIQKSGEYLLYKVPGRPQQR